MHNSANLHPVLKEGMLICLMLNCVRVLYDQEPLELQQVMDFFKHRRVEWRNGRIVPPPRTMSSIMKDYFFRLRRAEKWNCYIDIVAVRKMHADQLDCSLNPHMHNEAGNSSQHVTPHVTSEERVDIGPSIPVNGRRNV